MYDARMSTDDPFPPASETRLALDDEAVRTTDKLGRWLRVTGTIQLALSGLAVLFASLTLACGLGETLDAGVIAMLLLLIPMIIIAAYLLQGLRIQAAGEQFANLAQELHPDYLELAFSRLHTVFVIELVIGGFWLLDSLLEMGAAG